MSDMNIGKRIKGLRQTRHFSQARMAQVLEIPLSTYRQYEQGTRQCSLEVVKRASKVFSISYDYILDGGNMTPYNTVLEVAKFIREIEEKQKHSFSPKGFEKLLIAACKHISVKTAEEDVFTEKDMREVVYFLVDLKTS